MTCWLGIAHAASQMRAVNWVFQHHLRQLSCRSHTSTADLPPCRPMADEPQPSLSLAPGMTPPEVCPQPGLRPAGPSLRTGVAIGLARPTRSHTRSRLIKLASLRRSVGSLMSC